MRKSRINPISQKKLAQYKREVPIRIEIIEKGGGMPIAIPTPPFVICAGGRCGQCGGKPLGPEYPLVIHHEGIGADREELKRLENGEYNGELLCIYCHGKKHRIRMVKSEPQWSKRGIK